MRHDKLERELRLMLLLTENHYYTVPEICERIGISRRNLYYYLESFRNAGFKVEHRKPYYSIRKDSTWFKRLDAAVHFTEDEAIMMRQILEKTGDASAQVQHLIHKLDKLYDLNIVEKVELREQMSRNLTCLYDAIKQHRLVVLEGYSSPHSNTQSDRTVEPFLLMNGNQEVRCYELSSKMNKTFKLSRIQEVRLLDLLWSHEGEHRQMLTDVFMFSSEQQTMVTLRMGRLATALMREEYPRSEQYIEPDDDSHWIVEMPVSSYVGIGRFVIGLIDDIEVLADDGLRQYLKTKLTAISQKLNTIATE